MLKKMFKIAVFAAGLFAVTPVQSIFAQNLTEQLGQDPKVKIGTLPNGLKYYVRSNTKPANKVELRLVINAGSILEDNDQLGLAHFTEHMLFNGTKSFPKNELVSKLQSIGVQFGADLNAYTSFDETVYMLPIPTDKPENLETGFKILQEWAQGALMTDQDINEERKVILEESRLGKGAQDRMAKKFLPKLLAGTRYGQRLPIGKDELLKSFKPEVLRRYYKDWYRPNLMAVVVVGDISVEKGEQMVKEYFSSLSNPPKDRVRTVYEGKPYTKAEAMFLTDAEQTSNVFLLNFSTKKAAADKTVGDYRNSLIEQIAFAAINERLRDLAESGTPPYTAAGVGNDSYIRGHEAFSMYMVPSSDLTTGINAVVAQVLGAQKFGFGVNELELIKKNMLSNMEKAYNERNTTNSANFLGEYQRNFLEQEAMPGIEKEFSLYKQLLPGITAEEVTDAFRKLFTEADKSKFFALVMSPEKTEDKIKTDAALLAAVNNAFKQTPVEKSDVVINESLLDNQPTKGSIVNTEVNEKLGVTTYTLSNGVKVTVKPTDFKSDEVIFKGVKLGGASNYGVADKVNVNQLASVIETMGYGKYTPSELTKALSGNNISLTPSMDETSVTVSGSSDVKSLEKLFQLNYLQLTEPRLDEELLKGYVSKMSTQLKFIKANPQAAFVDTMLKVAYNNDPRAPFAFPTEEQLKSIDANRVIEIYKNEFSNADGFHYFIVGNVTEEQIRPLLEAYIASLPAKGTKPSFKDNGLRMKAGNNKFVFNKGTEQKSLTAIQYFGEMPFSEDMSLKAALLADIMTFRIIENLREEKAAIYSGGFQGEFQKNPYPHYVMATYLPSGPENVATIEKEIAAEIAKLKKDGPTEKDLDKAKIAILEKRKEQIKTNRYWSSKLEQLLFQNYSTERFLSFDEELNKITTKDLKEAANKFFDGKNSFIAVLNPEAKAEKK
jgi:zinc protease